MKTQIIEGSLEQIAMSSVSPAIGTYEGTWGGYVVTFQANGATWRARTALGTRTPAVPVIVTVTESEITVEVNPSESVKNRSR
jgi:hypothetical protein